MVNLKDWVPIRQINTHFDAEIQRTRMIQEKAKMDDFTRKDLFFKKRQLQKTTNQLNTYKVTNLLDPWVNKPPFKPRTRIRLP